MRVGVSLLTGLMAAFAATGLPSVASSQEDWQGFKEYSKTGLAFVEQSRDAIFLILTAAPPAEIGETPYEIVDISNVKKVSRGKRLDDSRVWQIETCRKQDLRYCPVARNLYRGTIFFDEGKTGYTCRHVIQNWRLWASNLNKRHIAGITPPIKLIDRSGVTVYSTARVESNQVLKVDFANIDPRLDINWSDNLRKGNPAAVGAFSASDFAVLSSNLTIGKPWKIRWATNLRQDFKGGDRTYIVGFPGKTDIFPKNEAGDSDGETQLATGGKVLGKVGVTRLVTSNLGWGGMSGGPAMKESGAVIGPYCSGGPNDDKSIAIKELAYVTVANRSALTHLWATMPYPEKP